MKILLAFYPIDDMGGIINHNEELANGLVELGHTVDSKIFLPRPDLPRNGKAGGRGCISPHSGMEFDQRRGYSWTNTECVPYRGHAKQWAVKTLESYDLVIWQVAVPTKRKENRGNSEWVDLYKSNVDQLAVIHDGNFLASYPWLYEIGDCLRGLICVHDCAYNSGASIAIPRTLIYNPQKVTYPDLSREAWEKRHKGFLSLQTWKAWKHVPELVAAVPHTQGLEIGLAGKGIDYYYLTSKDKCKWPGIWYSALKHGMRYLGVITNEERDHILEQVTCLVDPSWSKKYSAIGGHFNRVVVDAIMMGAVPVVRPLGISTNAEGFGELFKAGQNCVCIPQGATPQQYGAALTAACNMPYEQYAEIMRNAIKMLPFFERKFVGEQVAYLNEEGGDHTGETSDAVKRDSAKAMLEFFGDTNGQ